MNDPVEILLVEDDPADIDLALHAFEQNQLAHRVVVARDGEEALEILFGPQGRPPADPPKVILLDLKLPKVDGLEVLRRVRADARTWATPVVVLTSSADERDVVESYQLGVNSYIVKPVDFGKFSQAIQALNFYWVLLNRNPRPPAA